MNSREEQSKLKQTYVPIIRVRHKYLLFPRNRRASWRHQSQSSQNAAKMSVVDRVG